MIVKIVVILIYVKRICPSRRINLKILQSYLDSDLCPSESSGALDEAGGLSDGGRDLTGGRGSQFHFAVFDEGSPSRLGISCKRKVCWFCNEF